MNSFIALCSVNEINFILKTIAQVIIKLFFIKLFFERLYFPENCAVPNASFIKDNL